MAAVRSPPDIKVSAPIPVDQSKTDLDLMAFTMAALRYVNPWTVDRKESHAQPKYEPGVPEAKDRIISLSEVSLHDRPRDCWVVIYDRVYDITNFLDEHPGGADIMLEYAGSDASTAFRGSGHSKTAGKALEKFLIGELPLQERMYRRPGGMRLSDIPE